MPACARAAARFWNPDTAALLPVFKLCRPFTMRVLVEKPGR